MNGNRIVSLFIFAFMSNDFFASDSPVYLDDPQNRVEKEFNIPPDLKHKVNFWYKIYTQFNTLQQVAHDKDNMNIVYGNTQVDNKNLSYSAKRKVFNKKSKAYKALLVKSFKRIAKAKDLKKLKGFDLHVYQKLKAAGSVIPSNRKLRERFFKRKQRNIRFQTGQRDMIEKGIQNAKPFFGTLLKLANSFDIPRSLLVIPFLESSFNIRANSKTKAKGIWQFMKRTGNSFFKINRAVDHRLNPIISTLGAFHLLKQNKKILKRWDLAITAYNAGPKHLIRGSRKLKKRNIKPTLSNIIKYYKHPHIGFASKNFYAEFLALSRVLNYSDIIFKTTLFSKNRPTDTFDVYVSKCNQQYSFIKNHNQHFKTNTKKIKKRQLIVSNRPLAKKKFYQLNHGELKKKYPKNLWQLSRHHNCSTK